MPEFGPRPLDHIGTVAHPKLWEIKDLTLATFIQSAQRWGMDIPDPFWKLTHSRGYIGKLNQHYVVAMWKTGRITWREAKRLLKRSDWTLSMTDPEGIFEPWEEIKDREDWIISRPQFVDPSKVWQRRAWEHAMWWFYQRKYDRGQLLGILKDVLGQEDPKTYSRWADWGSELTVCSGAVLAGYEAVRRQGIMRWHVVRRGRSEWIHCNTVSAIGDETWTTSKPWPRILDGLHLERCAPGHLCKAPWFKIVAAKDPQFLEG